MSDFFEKVTSQADPLTKLIGYIPGFGGYIERQRRREADKMLRDVVARRFEEYWSRASNLQAELVGMGKIELMDDIEKATLALRTFIDKISRAARGYSGVFDAAKINEAELQAIYQFDLAFFTLGDQVSSALDNLEATLHEDEGLPAAIRHVATLARQSVEIFERRSEVVTGGRE